jgi:hypothetical protein
MPATLAGRVGSLLLLAVCNAMEGSMVMSQAVLNLVFFIVAAIVVLIFLAIRRYWEEKLNMSEEEELLERRMASLNERQANRRRDDEIVRLLRGDEHPTVGRRRDSEQD